MIEKLKEKKYRILSVSWDTNNSGVPIPIHYYFTTDEVEFTPTAIKERDLNIDIYIKNIEYLLSQTKNCRIVIFCPGGDPYKMFLLKIPVICKKYELQFFDFSNLLTVSKFENNPNSVLMISHSQSESININAEMCICIRPDWVNLERIGQMIGRTLRTTNKNKNVYVYHIMPKGYPKFKVIYSNMYSSIDLRSSVNDINSGELINAFKILNLLDPGLTKVTPYDIVAICNQHHNEFHNILLWWKEQKSSISDEIKERLFSIDSI